MSRTNETRHIKCHESCKCLCRLDPIICNNKQRWNENKCRCECIELTDKGVCDKGYFFNRSNCECECDKSCNIGAYLDYSNCKCRRKLIDPIIEECTENIDVVKIENENENDNKHKHNFFVVCIVLFFIIFTINVGIGNYFVYYHWYLKKYSLHVDFNTHKKTIIY